MDIREYWRVLQENTRFFWTLVFGLWLLSLVWLLAQPVRYQGTLLLNVGRTASEPSAEYSYDSFYRLQADERFADTLVRWLSNPRIVSDILTSAGTSPEHYTEAGLSGFFEAKRLSSQVVEVRFVGSTREGVQKYADALTEVTQEYTQGLNASQSNWFRVVGSEPVIRDARVSAWPFLVLSFCLALFIAFWAVLLKYFLVPETDVTHNSKTDATQNA